MIQASEYMPLTDQVEIPAQRISFLNELPYVDRVWLVSIMHSGTHFAMAHLESMGYKNAHVLWDSTTGIKMKRPEWSGKYQYIQTHIGIAPQWSRIFDEKVVLTLRDPVKIYHSHLYRYRWNEETYVEHIIKLFLDWKRILNMFDVHIFRVDAKIQKDEVERLRDYLGVRAWTYKEKSNTIGTAVAKPMSVESGFDEYRVNLWDNPPKEILELSKDFGY